MQSYLPEVIFAAGIGQLSVLCAAALVPFRLDWRKELQCLPRLHRQMYLVYGGYIALSILSLGLICVLNAAELAGGSGLARSFSVYGAAFWGIRLLLQGVFDVKAHLTTWWLKAGYHLLTVLFAVFTAIYVWAAVGATAF